MLVSNWCQSKRPEIQICGERQTRKHGGQGTTDVWTMTTSFTFPYFRYIDRLIDGNLTDSPQGAYMITQEGDILGWMNTLKAWGG
jgi:hypothetical protein